MFHSGVSIVDFEQANVWGGLFVCELVILHFISSFNNSELWPCARSSPIPGGKYLFKVNNRNTRTKCEICLKLTAKPPENVIEVFQVSLLLILVSFHTLL